jgi:hypothetical protein
MIGGIVSAVGNRISSLQQEQQMLSSAAQLRQDAKDAEFLGKQKAGIIRRSGRTTVSQARADFASSGVQVGTGSAREVEDEILRNVETDVVTVLFEAESKAAALRREAKQMKKQAQMLPITTTFENVGTVLGSGGIGGGK